MSDLHYTRALSSMKPPPPSTLRYHLLGFLYGTCAAWPAQNLRIMIISTLVFFGRSFTKAVSEYFEPIVLLDDICGQFCCARKLHNS